MGLLDELKKALEEASEQGPQGQRRQRPPPRPAPREDDEALDGQVQPRRLVADTPPAQASRPAADCGAPAPQSRPVRVLGLLRHPRSLREAMVLREVLDRPLALRRRR